MRLFCFFLLTLTLSCSNNNTKQTKLIHFIPNNTSVVFKVSNIEGLKSDIQNNSLLQELSKSEPSINLNTALETISIIQPENELLICFSKEKNNPLHYTIITKQHNSLFKTDSLPNYTKETFTSKNKSIEKHTLNNTIIYSRVINHVSLISSSKKIIEGDFLNSSKDLALEKIYNTTKKDKWLSIILKNNSDFFGSFYLGDSLAFKNFSDYSALDTDISEDNLIINGITKANDSLQSLINVFKGNTPQENQIQSITPLNSDGVLSFTFSDFKTLKTNLFKFNKKQTSTSHSLFNNLTEVGTIYMGDDQAIVLNTLDVLATKQALVSELNKIDSYRQIDIFSFSKPDLFTETLYPFITYKQATKYCLIDHFFVFSNHIETLQNIIANYQNKTTLVTQSYFTDIKTNLSDESSILLIANPSILKNTLNKMFNTNYNYALNKYNASALQFVYDSNFSHVHGIIKKTKPQRTKNSISEVFNIKLDTDILNTPQFVVNHITKQKEIIVQDVKNKLYLISNQGKILWKKQLQGPVLGNIKQVDMYKNGKLQLAFATPHYIYIIDRNGKDLNSFPKKFNDKITQPLSVFDYDKTKKYRLLITQDKKVSLYNTRWQIVKGFIFTSAKSSIISQPKHFRLHGKDYITIKTKNKLYILNRLGKTRVTPKTSHNYSYQDIFLYKNKFTTTTNQGHLVLIDTRGQVATQNLKLSENHKIDATNKTLVTLSENKLSIKNRTIELDYGSYTPPKIFYLNNKIYVSVTDLQSQQIHLFDSQAKPIANFPIYGKSKISLDNLDKDKNLELVTTGDTNAIILYQIN